jgi:hypothetical protein
MKLSLVLLVLVACIICRGQKVVVSHTFPIVNTDIVSILLNSPSKFQLNVKKVSGIVQGKVLAYTSIRDKNGTVVGWDQLKEFDLVNVNYQTFVVDVFFERLTIETKGTMLLNIKYYYRQ